jgi:tetratricopeptide (TPR) repeat protein
MHRTIVSQTNTQASNATAIARALLTTSALLCASALAFSSWAKASTPESSPAMKKIVAAERFIASNAKSPSGYVELAMAYAKRARETGDDTFYDKAIDAADKALAIDASNFEAKKARVWILLGQHDFGSAAVEAKALNKLVPDDVMVYGLMTDAYIELGRYDEAEKSAQWMLDLRAGNVPGLTRGAYLRELFGDIEGALEMMDMALRRMSETEYEERAWLLTHVGHLQLLAGRVDLAEQVVNEALRTFPNYHYAIQKLAQVRMKQARAKDAAELLAKRYEIAAHPENLFEAAAAMHAAGMKKEATATFRKFEKEALAESENVDNANRELAIYYLDFANKAKDGLRLAKMQFDRRQDVHTMSVYAWALHKNGRSKEAFELAERATAIGTRDARVRYYAGVIAKANKATTKSSDHLAIAAATAKEVDLARSIQNARRG